MKYIEKHHCVWLGHECPLKENFREPTIVQKYDSFLFHGKSEHRQKCTCKKNKQLSCMFSAHLWWVTDNNLSSSNWFSDWRHWLNTNMLFPELFCLGAVWKRHNNYWIILELMISSDAISLNTWVNIAGRISLHLPGL